jgi:hypothetical protein
LEKFRPQVMVSVVLMAPACVVFVAPLTVYVEKVPAG